MKSDVSSFYSTEPRLSGLVELCKSEMNAAEVWLFGSRSRGDHRPDSDWDILAVVPDNSPDELDCPISAFRLRRKSGVPADLLTVRRSEFLSSLNTVNTISYAVKREGIRLDAQSREDCQPCEYCSF